MKSRWESLVARGPSVWMLIALAVLLWGGEFLFRGLWEPDEARYALVAREMSEEANWLVPHIHGEPYPDKPPLMFWLMNLAAPFCGGQVGRVAARLPSLLGSILTMWAMSNLLKRWHSAKAAWLSVLVLMSSYLFWHQGGWGQIDALLCGLVLISIYFFFTSEEGRGVGRLVWAYVFAGLAVLAKGPVGLLLPVGIYAVTLGAGDRDSRLKLRRWHWLWGSLIAVSIPGAWLVAAWMADAPAEYFRRMLGSKSFGRVVQAVGHNRPFFYFFWHFPVDFLPWALFLPLAWRAIPGGLLKRRLVAWILFVILLFSAFACKRHLYIMSAFPAAAMFVALGWAHPERMAARGVKAIVATVGVLLAGGGIALVAASFFVSMPIAPWRTYVLAVVLLLGAGTVGRCCRREGITGRLGACMAMSILAVETCVGAVVLPGVNERKGPVAFGKEVQEIVPPGQKVLLYADQLAIIPLYANRLGKQVRSLEQLVQIVNDQRKGVVVFRKTEWKKVEAELSPYFSVHEFEMGNKSLVWAEFPRRADRAPTENR